MGLFIYLYLFSDSFSESFWSNLNELFKSSSFSDYLNIYWAFYFSYYVFNSRVYFITSFLVSSFSFSFNKLWFYLTIFLVFISYVQILIFKLTLPASSVSNPNLLTISEYPWLSIYYVLTNSSSFWILTDPPRKNWWISVSMDTLGLQVSISISW